MTHPLGFSHSEPSVAALVGSLDKECSQFASRVWLQGHRIEMLQVRLTCHHPACPRLEAGLGVSKPWSRPWSACCLLGDGDSEHAHEGWGRHAVRTGLGAVGGLIEDPGWPEQDVWSVSAGVLCWLAAHEHGVSPSMMAKAHA